MPFRVSSTELLPEPTTGSRRRRGSRNAAQPRLYQLVRQQGAITDHVRDRVPRARRRGLRVHVRLGGAAQADHFVGEAEVVAGCCRTASSSASRRGRHPNRRIVVGCAWVAGGRGVAEDGAQPFAISTTAFLSELDAPPCPRQAARSSRNRARTGSWPARRAAASPGWTCRTERASRRSFRRRAPSWLCGPDWSQIGASISCSSAWSAPIRFGPVTRVLLHVHSP